MWLASEFLQIVTNLQNFFQYIYWKKSMYKWACTVQTRVVEGLTVHSLQNKKQEEIYFVLNESSKYYHHDLVGCFLLHPQG